MGRIGVAQMDAPVDVSLAFDIVSIEGDIAEDSPTLTCGEDIRKQDLLGLDNFP